MVWQGKGTPPKTNMSPEKGTISIGNASTNDHFSGDMLVFRGVNQKTNGASAIAKSKR